MRTAVLDPSADTDPPVPRQVTPDIPAEVEAMLGSLALYQDQITTERHAPDQRLLTVLGSLASARGLVTDQGQVSLLDDTARELLGPARPRRHLTVRHAEPRVGAGRHGARTQGRARPRVAVRGLDGATLQGRVVLLPDDEGAVVIFPAVELDRHRPASISTFDCTTSRLAPSR